MNEYDSYLGSISDYMEYTKISSNWENICRDIYSDGAISNWRNGDSIYYNYEIIENEDYLKVPGWYDFLDFFIGDGILKYAKFYENISTLLDYGALVIDKNYRKYGISDVKKNTWIFVTFNDSGNNIMLDYLFGDHGSKEEILSDFIEALDRFKELLIEYFDKMDYNLCLLTFIAFQDSKSFVEEENFYNLLYTKPSPKSGWSIRKGGLSFEQNKRYKEFSKVSIPCDINFIRSYDSGSVYNIACLQDLRNAYISELYSLISRSLEDGL